MGLTPAPHQRPASPHTPRLSRGRRPRRLTVVPDQVPFQVRSLRTSNVVIVKVAGEVDLLTAPPLHDVLRLALDECPGAVVIDVSDLRFCDVRGLAVLEAFWTRARQRGSAFVMAGRCTGLRRLWRIASSLAMPPCYPTVVTALGHVATNGHNTRTPVSPAGQPRQWEGSCVTGRTGDRRPRPPGVVRVSGRWE